MTAIKVSVMTDEIGDGPEIIHGDCIEVMLGMGDNSVDSIVTDPPYGLGFMGKEWDQLPPGQDWAEECLRVLKPGGYLLAFGGTRTWHRLAVAIEDAGFAMRDSLAWLYGTGMPKHRASLKPAFEPIVMARKPFKGSLIANDAKHGTGALNIESSRIEGDRWPTNVMLDVDAGVALDKQSGTRTSGALKPYAEARRDRYSGAMPAVRNVSRDADSGGASRFFYVTKAAKKERPVVDGKSHATVKPLELMQHLVRLVTPHGGTVLDTFAGSGTTVEACILEGFHCIAIEREAEYLPLIQQRIERAA